MKLRVLPAVVRLVVCFGLLFGAFFTPDTLLWGAEPSVQGIDQWLALGPAEVPAISKAILGDSKSILDYRHLSIVDLLPIEGAQVPWSASRMLKWEILTNQEFAAYETGVVYLATYLEPSRWMETTLNIHNTNLGVAVFLDGTTKKAQVLKDKITADLTLTNEKHLLVLKILLIKGEKFNFKASLENKEGLGDNKVAISLSPMSKLKPDHILNTVQARNIEVSPDGKRVAVSLNQTHKDSGKPETWLEILDTTNGTTIFSSRGTGNITDFRWLNNSTTFSFSRANKEITSLFLYDLNTCSQSALLENIKDFSTYWWAPDNSFLVYSTLHMPESKDYKYIKEIADRAVDPAGKSEMTLFFPKGGASHRISDEGANYESAVISPDSKTILFQANIDDNKIRPYLRAAFYLCNVSTLTTEKVLESVWLNSAQFSPDSQQLLLLGGASAFDGLGNTLPKEIIPNDFDIQAYIYDLKTKKTEAISRTFDPSIDKSYWSPAGDVIYFQAKDKEEQGLFKYAVKKKTYTRLNMGIDVVTDISYAKSRNLAVYWGCSATVPYKLYKINLPGGPGSLLKDYNTRDFLQTAMGTVKVWNYKTTEGKTIYGHIFYPPDFDSTQKYPCIVYYYGGTTPVTRDFGGRYPKGWYAANGYIVYVLQPSGAVGFGQEFSASHVNDWGKTSATEIIAAVKQLLVEHKYIDRERIGAMGASYGGFMTQYLAAQTDIFAAFVSHAGITSLASYWGVGDYGYNYSGVATAASFPWNRKDIYVGNSPLFMADRINKPLLLLHGDADNNVPPGESYQMFAALKLLGKDVALITFKDQKHFIVDYKLRLQWMRTIIAWFDKYLKKQPAHWKNMYE